MSLFVLLDAFLINAAQRFYICMFDPVQVLVVNAFLREN
ncbi:hypothetical protein SEVIR_5G075775v4 [Setaria viridis]